MVARPRRKRLAFLAATAVLFSLWMQPACRPMPHVAVEQAPVDSAMGGFPVPQQVRRVAVWYPRTWDRVSRDTIGEAECVRLREAFPSELNDDRLYYT
jgi:hypothetical protein